MTGAGSRQWSQIAHAAIHPETTALIPDIRGGFMSVPLTPWGDDSLLTATQTQIIEHACREPPMAARASRHAGSCRVDDGSRVGACILVSTFDWGIAATYRSHVDLRQGAALIAFWGIERCARLELVPKAD